MRHNNNTESAKEFQLGVLALKMENAKLKRAIKDYEKRITSLKAVCRLKSTIDMGDGTHACQFAGVPIYEIARCIDSIQCSPLGHNELFFEAGWTAHKE